MSAQRRLLLSVLGLVAVIAVGTVGFMLEAGVPFGEAAYMTVITVSTVGYGEVWRMDAGGRIWTVVVILFGVGAMSFGLSSLFTLLVSGELQTIRGRLRMQAQIDRLAGHVVVCGYGRMGAMTAADLVSLGLVVVVVESDASKAEHLDAEKTAYVLGDATEDGTLQKAGIARARALVSTLPTDSDNVYVTLSARGLRPDLTIIARAEQPSTEVKLLRAGATRVVCPQIIGANRIANLIARPHVVEFVEVAARGVELEISEHQIGPSSLIRDRTLRESELRSRFGGMVVAIRRADGTMVFSPGPEQPIRESDTLVIIGTRGISERLTTLNIS